MSLIDVGSSGARSVCTASGGRASWRSLKRGALRAVQAGLELSGLARLYARLSGSAGATVLMFHSIAQTREAAWIDPRYHMTPAAFDRRMKFLAARRRPVSLASLVQAIQDGRNLPPRSVVVTFDDGYVDHRTIAAPILLKYGIPATFFVPTGYVGRVENPWVDRLHAAFRFRTRHTLSLPEPAVRTFDLRGPSGEALALHAAHGLLLAAPCPQRRRHLDVIDEQLRPAGAAPRLTMDWNDVRSLRNLSADFEIGGHTRNHLDLTRLDPEEARREISGCADDLRRELGPEPRDFSFPYERWSGPVKEEVRRQGFRSACGQGSEFLIGSRSDRFAMPRLDPLHLRSAFGFATSGAYPALSRTLTGRV